MLEQLKTLIRRFEGWRSRPYLCPAGIPTIGYGATYYPDGRRVRLSDPPLSLLEGEALLDHDADAYERLAVKISPRLLTEPVRAQAIADFVYNLGAARYRGSTLRRKVNEGNWPEAAEQLGRWVFGGGRKLPGLVVRRAADATLILQGGDVVDDGDPPAAAAPPLSREDLSAMLREANGAADPIATLLALLQAKATAA